MVKFVILLSLQLFLFYIYKADLTSCSNFNIGFAFFEQREENLGTNYLLSTCCKECSDKKAQAMAWYSVNQDPSFRAECRCSYGVIKKIVQAGDTAAIIYQKKFQPENVLEEGVKTKIHVVDFYDHVFANDRNEFYAFTDVKNINRKSKSIQVLNIDREALKLEKIIDLESKRKNSVILNVEQEKSWDRSYIFTIMAFGLNHEQQNDKLWFAMIRSNDKYLNFHAERINVTKADTYKCNLDNFKVTSWIRKRKLKVAAVMKTSASCNTDLSNITFSVTVEAGLSVENINGQNDCIQISKSWSSGNTFFIKYSMLYAVELICFNFDVVVNKRLKIFHGSKKLSIIVNTFTNEKNYTRVIQSVLSNNKNVKKGFYMDIDGVKCVNQLQEPPFLYINHPKETSGKYLMESCTKFKLVNHLLTSEKGTCVSENSNELFLTKCDDVDHSLVTWSKGTEFKVKGTSVRTLDYRLTNGHLTSLEFTRRYTNEFGISKNESIEGSISDIISIIKSEQVYMICTQTNNKTVVKCLQFYVGKMFHLLNSRFVSLLSYETTEQKLYGKDKKGTIIYQAIEKKGKKTYAISFKRWKIIKEKYNASMIHAHYIERNDLVNRTVKIGDKTEVTYIGINEDGNHVLTWPADSDCVKNIGSTKETAYRNCNEMKRFCPKAISREYWITQSYGKGPNGKIYCDMETGDGGWMLLGSYTVPNKTGLPSLSELTTNDIFAVVASNYTKMITDVTGLITTQNIVGTFIQLRFYCTASHVNRTIHFETTRTANGEDYIRWILNSVIHTPSACGRYKLYDDDNSMLMKDCTKIESIERFSTAIVTNPFSTSHKRFQLLSHDCDTKKDNNEVLKQGTWKIYVRSL